MYIRSMEWTDYWEAFITKKKLHSKVKAMDEMDVALGGKPQTEEICRLIHEDYNKNYKGYLETVRDEFLKELDKFSSVHLQSNRIKKIDSLLEKIITKRYSTLKDSKSGYANISVDNYKEIVTDLIGMRIIINYRGNWTLIHEEIVARFPFDIKLFENGQASTLPHLEDGQPRLAQIPVANYAAGDEKSGYEAKNLHTKLHKKNYRSIHYIVSYQKVYIEIQVRTIYDEAWSDCDHSYVYKHDENKSHTSLERLSGVLCKITNLANDMGDNMKVIYDSRPIIDAGSGKWITDAGNKHVLEEQLRRLAEAKEDFQKFIDSISVIMGGGEE